MAFTQRRIRRWIIPITILLFSGSVLTLGVLWSMLNMEISAGENGRVLIPRNTSVIAAIDSVNATCPLPSPWLVKLAARITQRLRPRSIQSGWYLFQQGDTQFDVLQDLFTGKRRPTVRVTLPEGLTKWETADKLASALDVDSTAMLKAVDTLEGKLFPNTYEFFWREDPSDVVKRLTNEYTRQTKTQPPTQAELILASIVQAEAASVAEMPRIAGVYVNRLERGVNLEADPTVQYGLQSRVRLTYGHLGQDHAWNTYVRSGLPPTPICSPGIAAIKAAQHPEKHTYMFFVAKGDSTGTHRFANSFGDHLRNVQQYRRTRSAKH